jgi:hypothetical protein
LSSLEGKFYFNDPAGGSDRAIESKRLYDERLKVAQERELLEKQRALAEEREKLEALKREQAKPSPPAAQKKEVAIVTPSTVTGPKETARDGRFIAYDNGTVLDTKTNLLWAAKDNGSDINWANAKNYCENYRGGGYTDWRMPTQGELEGLYDENKSRTAGCYRKATIQVATELIDITCFAAWASEMKGSNAAIFRFDTGYKRWEDMTWINFQALPVRSVK